MRNSRPYLSRTPLQVWRTHGTFPSTARTGPAWETGAGEGHIMEGLRQDCLGAGRGAERNKLVMELSAVVMWN